VGYTARFLGLSHAPVSRSISTLRKKGFLAQHEHPFDARGAVFQLTKDGQRLTTSDPLHRLSHIIDALPEEQRTCFRLAVVQIVTDLTKIPDED
jgi:DNA-binding MarR family transcriptional regulator